MKEGEFWTLIEETRAAADGNDERQAALLADRLATRPAADIVSFGKWYHQKMDVVNEAGVLHAAGWVYLAHGLGSPSGDGWEYFHSWLVARGRADFEAVVRDPDVLADLFTDIDDFLGGEVVRYAAGDAYERVTGISECPDEMHEPCPLEAWPRRDLIGVENLNRDGARRRFPRLYARFGDRPDADA